MTKRNWVDVDIDGLAKLVADRPKIFILHELIQNAQDENTTCVKVSIEMVPGRPLSKIVVEDDSPEGFKNLSDAYTLFAESYKKDNPEKAGRFNFGEKLVLSQCVEATITTTTGTIRFDESGRHQTRAKREKGSVFEAFVKMTRVEYDDIIKDLNTLLPNKNIDLYLNDKLFKKQIPIHTFTAQLPTLKSDEEGVLRATKRNTTVELYEPNGQAFIYELGIPVVETDIQYSVNVLQKVPLNLDRDNVTVAFKNELLKHVLNNTYELLTKDQADNKWISEAAGINGISKEAVEKVAKLQFGDKFVALDPTDKESAEKAQTEGYSVIGPRSITKEQREQLKKFDLIKSSSDIFPTPKPFSNNPDDPPAEYLDYSEWSKGMYKTEEYVKYLGKKLLNLGISVRIVKSMGTTACYGGETITLNLKALGKKWFDNVASEDMNRLLLHEFGHEYSSSHHHEDFYKALENLGAKLVEIVCTDLDIYMEFKR